MRYSSELETVGNVRETWLYFFYMRPEHRAEEANTTPTDLHIYLVEMDSFQILESYQILKSYQKLESWIRPKRWNLFLKFWLKVCTVH